MKFNFLSLDNQCIFNYYENRLNITIGNEYICLSVPELRTNIIIELIFPSSVLSASHPQIPICACYKKSTLVTHSLHYLLVSTSFVIINQHCSLRQFVFRCVLRETSFNWLDNNKVGWRDQDVYSITIIWYFLQASNTCTSSSLFSQYTDILLQSLNLHYTQQIGNFIRNR